MKVNLPIKFQLRIYLSRLEKREGACSQIFTDTDKHILLWDFDNTPINEIELSLRAIMIEYRLPPIYIILSSPYSYHAYCFTARSFREVIHILSATPQVDLYYLRLGMVRGYYTLRITPRKNDNFKLITILKSSICNEVDPMDITINEYLTINKGTKKGDRNA